MQAVKLTELINGSDIRGYACLDKDSTRYNLGLRETAAIAEAFLDYIAFKLKKDVSELKISIGHDSRVTAKRLSYAFCFGLLEKNVGEAIYFALSSTPAMFMSTVDDSTKVDAAVMLTASHLPRTRNGIKFFTASGGLSSADIKAIIERAEKIYASKYVEFDDIPVYAKNLSSDETNDLYLRFKKRYENELGKRILERPFMDRYAEILRNKIISELGSARSVSDVDEENSSISACGERPLANMHIIVDAGNGAGGFYATKVLEPLGANISGSLYLEADGTFPNHIPNPEDKTALPAIQRAVREQGADLGVIFDTDVDRSALIAADGREINRNRLIALISHILLEEKPGATIVTDSITSVGLKEFIEERTGRQQRFKRGYKNVINEAIRLNQEGVRTPLAIETSGHAAFAENYFLDDGAYLATRILIYATKLKRMGKTIEHCISDLAEAEYSTEKRLTILAEDFRKFGESTINELTESIKENEGKSFMSYGLKYYLVEPNYEGLRVNVSDGQEKAWFLLRLSLHEPLLVLNLEGDRLICEKIEKDLDRYFSDNPALL